MADLSIPIETERLRLRPFTIADVDAVHAYHGLDEVARYQYWEQRSRDEVVQAEGFAEALDVGASI